MRPETEEAGAGTDEGVRGGTTFLCAWESSDAGESPKDLISGSDRPKRTNNRKPRKVILTRDLNVRFMDQ